MYRHDRGALDYIFQPVVLMPKEIVFTFRRLTFRNGQPDGVAFLSAQPRPAFEHIVSDTGSKSTIGNIEN